MNEHKMPRPGWWMVDGAGGSARPPPSWMRNLMNHTAVDALRARNRESLFSFRDYQPDVNFLVTFAKSVILPASVFCSLRALVVEIQYSAPELLFG